MLRFTIGLVLAAAALASLGFAHAQSTDDSLRIYAVDIWQDPPQSWGPGRGVYLGKGLVLTAAHVVGSAADTKPRVHIAGMELPATAIREGNFERVGPDAPFRGRAEAPGLFADSPHAAM
jgi:hypothetical protein